MPGKTLIITYSFPPSPEIGGRRWAKFSKYLHRQSVPIKIITSRPINIKDNWTKDISDFEDKIIRISFNSPYYLGINPKTLFEKIMYRLSLLWSKKMTKGNYYDKAIYCKKTLLLKVEGYLRAGYKNIIVSVAPFHLATNIAKLKHKYKGCNFIVDFRDPWIGNDTSYGYSGLSKVRQAFEQQSEKIVIESYDTIITVSDTITNHLKTKYPNSNAVFLTIPNGFDKEDIELETNEQNSPQTDNINLVFTGTFYDGAKKYLIKLCEWLDQIQEFSPELYNRLSINFYGKINIAKGITNRHQLINFNGFIPTKEVYKVINESNACLLFLTDDISYSFSTKFCEYIALKKPIIVLSKNGYTGKYVEKNKLGHSLNTNDSAQKLKEILLNIKNNKNKYYQSYSIQKFEIETITETLLSILK